MRSQGKNSSGRDRKFNQFFVNQIQSTLNLNEEQKSEISQEKNKEQVGKVEIEE